MECMLLKVSTQKPVKHLTSKTKSSTISSTSKNKRSWPTSFSLSITAETSSKKCWQQPTIITRCKYSRSSKSRLGIRTFQKQGTSSVSFRKSSSQFRQQSHSWGERDKVLHMYQNLVWAQTQIKCSLRLVRVKAEIAKMNSMRRYSSLIKLFGLTTTRKHCS